jgi:hypothetical protein
MPKYFAYYRKPFLLLATFCALSLWLFIRLGQIKSLYEWNWVDILGEGGATVFIGIWIFLLSKAALWVESPIICFMDCALLFFSICGWILWMSLSAYPKKSFGMPG